MSAEAKPLRSRALRILRLLPDWPQKRLAAAAGVQLSTISDYERGKKVPSVATLRRLAAALGLPDSKVDETLALLGDPAAAQAVPAATAARREAAGPVERQIGEATALAGPAAEDFLHTVLAGFVRALRRELEDRQAKELWARLARYSFDQQIALVELGQKFRHRGLCRLLCNESLKAARDSADRALALARLALRIAELAPGEPEEQANLRGFAGFHLGNALRVKGELKPGAEAAFSHAKTLWEEGAAVANPLDAVRILDLEASFRRDQRRLPEALDLLDRALALDVSGRRAGRLLINRAKTLEELDDYAGAVETLRRAAPLVEREGDPQLLFAQRFNLLFDLTHLGKHAQAAAGLPEVQALAARNGNALDGVRLTWLEGRIAAGLGRVDEAIVLFSRARSEFAARDIPYDTALVTLELALVYAEQGRTAQVKALARQSGPVFEAQDVHREALAAFALFRRAAEEERITVSLLRRLLAYFRQARHDPDLRFEG